jgi:hypothetical protein
MFSGAGMIPGSHNATTTVGEFLIFYRQPEFKHAHYLHDSSSFPAIGNH